MWQTESSPVAFQVLPPTFQTLPVSFFFFTRRTCEMDSKDSGNISSDPARLELQHLNTRWHDPDRPHTAVRTSFSITLIKSRPSCPSTWASSSLLAASRCATGATIRRQRDTVKLRRPRWDSDCGCLRLVNDVNLIFNTSKTLQSDAQCDDSLVCVWVINTAQ